MTSGIIYVDIDMEHFEKRFEPVIKAGFNKEEPAEYLFYDKSFLEIFVLPFLKKTSIN